MHSLRPILIAFLGLSVFAPWLAAEEPQRSQVQGARPVPPSDDDLPPGAVMRLGTARFRDHHRWYVVAYSPDGKLLASGGYGGVVLWDAQSGERRAFLESRLTSLAASTGKKDRRFVYSLAFSNDGCYLAAGCDGETIIWELVTHKVSYLPGDDTRGSPIDLVGFTSDNRGLFTGNAYEVRLRDWKTGKDLKKRWTVPARRSDRPDMGVFKHKSLSADGKIVAAVVFEDNLNISLRVWEVGSEENRRIPDIKVEARWIHSLSPDHTTLAVLGQKLTLFDVATGKVLRTWPLKMREGAAGDIPSETQ